MKIKQVPTIFELKSLFVYINKRLQNSNCKIHNFSDEEFYSEEIYKIFNVTKEEADILAFDLAHLS